jgi:DNA gyrase subunit B
MSDVSPAGDEAGPVVPNEYRAEDVQVHTGLEHIRKRPGMYVGDTGSRGLHHLVYELVYNAINEWLAGFCKRVTVSLHDNGECRVADDGRGIPVDIVPGLRLPFLELALTTVAAGGRYPREQPFLVAAGLRGIGLKAVNALSERLQVEVRRDGQLWRQEYRRGSSRGPLEGVTPATTTGTAITFWPDPDIFKGDRHFHFATLADRLSQLAFLNAGLVIRLIDERRTPLLTETYHFEDGAADYVRRLNAARRPAHQNVLHFRVREEAGEAEVALQWTWERGAALLSFANCHFTSQGGTHLAGLTRAIRPALLSHLRFRGFLTDAQPAPNREDCLAGLTGVVVVNVQEPVFYGATKEMLSNPEILTLVRRTASLHLNEFLRAHPADADAICRPVLTARDERLERRQLRRT